MHFLVAGGAGYIGSHVVRALLQQGQTSVILDDFSTGHCWATEGQEVLEIDLKDLNALRTGVSGRQFDGVFHFAAKSLVGEPNQGPLKYYQNNVGGTAHLLEVTLDNGWNKCFFSSIAAIYGTPITETISEEQSKSPTNVNGQTKLAMEELLESICKAREFSAVCLRHFNAAGASSDASIEEAHEPETHLTPNALKAGSGTGQPLTISRADYPTRDGTCIRGYIDVEDLADALLEAMDYLQRHTGFAAFNLGNGQGFSVKELFASFAAGEEAGSGMITADAARARNVFRGQPCVADIIEIVGSASRWEVKISAWTLLIIKRIVEKLQPLGLGRLLPLLTSMEPNYS